MRVPDKLLWVRPSVRTCLALRRSKAWRRCAAHPADKLPTSKVALKSKVRPPRERAHFMKLGWATTILIPIRGTQRI